MTKPSKRDTLWLLGIVALTGAILLIIAFAPADGESIRAQLAKLRAEAKTRRFSRSVFGAQTTPGNAWGDYQPAINQASALRGTTKGLIVYRFSLGKSSVEESKYARKVVAENGAALDLLRRGVRREDGQYPYDWESGSIADAPGFLASRMLANLAAAHAKVLSEDGHAREAMDLALDLFVFARDLSANGTTLSDGIGAAVYAVAADSIRELLLSGKLTAQDLEDLTARLETVEHDMPDQGAAFANDSLFIGHAMLRPSSQYSDPKAWLNLMGSGGWRYRSVSTMAENVIQTQLGYLERLQKLGPMDFASAMKEAEALEKNAAASKNPWVNQLGLHAISTVTARREALAKLRLLRAAALWSATGRVPKLADPFGTDLMAKEEDGKIIIWSAGSDGKDEGGKGAWDPGIPSDAERSKTGNDIVLQLPKPPRVK
jgi:hypothetical protein